MFRKIHRCAATLVLALAIGGCWSSPARAAHNQEPVRVRLGDAVVALNGPWKFHTGDDPRWAEPNFDDSSWEIVDLTPPPGAHDSDVGLTGYVPGWQPKGHRGYFGYAWYRIRVLIDAPPKEPLALNGPFYIDSAYRVFLNGELLGGAGNFSKRTPAAYNDHLPKLFQLPQSSEPASSGIEGSTLIAVRVWMGPWALRDPDAGGIHIAPALGTLAGAESVYRFQWSEMIDGYIVDAAEALLFLILAVMACTLIPFDRASPAYLWLAAALVLIGLRRGNQPFFFWWQFETIHGFELATIVLLIPLSLAAFTLAWCTWLRLREYSWMPRIVGGLTLLYIVSETVLRSWFYGDFPHWFSSLANFCVTSVRLAFLLLTLLIIFRCAFQSGREKWLVLPSILLISIGLFAQELSALHVPGIWFPFGVGVSLTEYAYAVFDAVLFALLLHRLYALRQQPAIDIALLD
jgi:hypothetical protein